MKFKLLFFLIFASFIIPSLTNSHGPSRQKVKHTMEINAEMGNVWKIVSDFRNFKWNPELKSVSAESNKIGSERILSFLDGSLVTQKLEKLDENKKMVSWRVVETDNKALPVNSYSAKILIKEKSQDTVEVIYKAGFYRGFMGNDPPDELNDLNSKKKVSDFILKSLNGLKKIAENN